MSTKIGMIKIFLKLHYFIFMNFLRAFIAYVFYVQYGIGECGLNEKYAFIKKSTIFAQS